MNQITIEHTESELLIRVPQSTAPKVPTKKDIAVEIGRRYHELKSTWGGARRGVETTGNAGKVVAEAYGVDESTVRSHQNVYLVRRAIEGDPKAIEAFSSKKVKLGDIQKVWSIARTIEDEAEKTVTIAAKLIQIFEQK